MWRLLPIFAATAVFANGPIDDAELARLVPETRRAAVHEALRLAGANAGALADALRQVPETNRDAMTFLAAWLPQSDLASMTADDLLDNVALAVQAHEETPWAKEVPYDVWLAFVLPHRCAQEPFEKYRRPFHDELAPRVAKLPSLREAALEVNRWCHENATFQPTSARDQGPLTTRKRGIGRCEEEMILYIAVARSVGIPARPVFTRYWPFMDNNHAWVEVYADGGWHYLGACEPAADLDQAWFSEAASRAGMVVTMAYGVLQGPQVYRTGRSFSILNTTSVYGETGRLRVRIEREGNPVPNRDAFACVFNFGGLRTLTRMITGEDGHAEVELGTGDYVVVAGEGEAYDQTVVTVAAGKTTEAVLDVDSDRPFGAPFWLRDPPRAPRAREGGGAAAPVDPTVAGLQGQVRDLRRRVAELEHRAVDKDLIAFLETTDSWIGRFAHVLIDARGNWKAIADAAREMNEEERKDLLALLEGLETKDRVEVPREALVEHVRMARKARREEFAGDDELYRSYVLAPRIGDEPLRAWRASVQNRVFEDTVKGDPTVIAHIVNRRVNELCEVREPDPLGNALTPADVLVSGGGTERDIAVAAVGALRASGIPARLAGTWAEFHDGREWKPLYPKDPENLGNPRRDEKASAQYAERGTVGISFRRRGQPTTEVENGREFAIMACRNGSFHDLDAGERKVGNRILLDVRPGRAVLFAGVRSRRGEPYIRPFTVNVEAGKEVSLTVDLDLPAGEVLRQRKSERKLDRAPTVHGVDWDGATVVFLHGHGHEPSERMEPLVRAWCQGREGVRLLAAVDGSTEFARLALAFQLPAKDGAFTSLPAVILVKDGEILLWEEGYNLAIVDALEEAWGRTR